MQLHQHTPSHRPHAGSLLQFLITLCMLIWNINLTFTSKDTFSFHAGMLSCVYETSECFCSCIKERWCVSPYHQSLKQPQGVFNWLWNSLSLILMPLYDLCKQTRPSASRWAILYSYSKCLPPGQISHWNQTKWFKGHRPEEPMFTLHVAL